MFLFDFCHISLTVKTIRAITEIPTPQSAPCTYELFVKAPKTEASSTIHQKGTNVTPIMAATAPHLPFSLYPINIDIFAAIIPGRD